jgi:predicted acyltransferase
MNFNKNSRSAIASMEREIILPIFQTFLNRHMAELYIQPKSTDVANGISPIPEPKIATRLMSLDFVRGLTMVLLTLESTHLYNNLQPAVEGTAAILLLNQFFHHPWHGLRLWDLVQPVFMFVAGTALAFSIRKQRQHVTWGQSFRKILKRCFWLFFWGVLDYAVRENGLSFELWNVLTQLAFTTLVTFLIIDFPAMAQIVISFLCLLIPELLYRYAGIPGFDQPFTDQHNFGNYMDLVLMNKINSDGWVAINCISTSAHTIWGALVGKLLLSNKSSGQKLRYLIGSGVLLLLLGFGLDWTGVTPIIKRIATSTFVLASGGWCLLFLAFSYWWIDIKEHKRYLLFFLIFGMNSIFIYLFFEIVASRWFNGYVQAITGGLLDFVHFPKTAAVIVGSLVIFALEFGLLYFLYRKKLFFTV